MPIASRIRLGKVSPSRNHDASARTRPADAWEERWWFPIGSITRIGEGVFRWHCVASEPDSGQVFVFSGRLCLEDGVGYLLDEDTDEGNVDEDPCRNWLDNLAPFPYAHLFFDGTMDFEDSETGPWFCIHCHYGKDRASVEAACETDLDRVAFF